MCICVFMYFSNCVLALHTYLLHLHGALTGLGDATQPAADARGRGRGKGRGSGRGRVICRGRGLEGLRRSYRDLEGLRGS